ncbi:hypothetical protein [Halalkalibacter akibai]|uniref:Uncharacterized protein n=1 Tax=Halalkalibacter akibai (strain ATCC 43226 / DSM 21942 / CIP 109018 / JCM 9157 / 1139) TaxID=1236973 RepID=W4QXX7_HALA3|nr:hypothetical protein [Halalkalibacter akibai]GAE36970.1 hypothetical protein JCM9157_4208 [Halalkalibacter akibai JCM 9157]
MTSWNGQILCGEYDKTGNEFIVRKVKNQSTQSVLKKKQVDKLYRYLKNHHEEGHIITLYDQMLLTLSKEDVDSLLNDLEEIESFYH